MFQVSYTSNSEVILQLWLPELGVTEGKLDEDIQKLQISGYKINIRDKT